MKMRVFISTFLCFMLVPLIRGTLEWLPTRSVEYWPTMLGTLAMVAPIAVVAAALIAWILQKAEKARKSAESESNDSSA